ncbi:MAG: GreA/GreB family elongation factor [Candidatus Vogelbacteria bacterium]|nr:GreA/GreB family elongation factor [Candidatus Vogelbacteria bacterium]
MLYFLKEDLEALKKRRDTLYESYLEASKAMGEACEQSSETWHDNAPYDEAKRAAEGLNTQVSGFNEMIARASLVECPASPPKNVCIGCEVHYQQQSSGEERSVLIGSFWVPMDSSEGSPRRISYQSPVGKSFIGHKIGDTVTAVLPKGAEKYLITAINVPTSEAAQQ